MLLGAYLSTVKKTNFCCKMTSKNCLVVDIYNILLLYNILILPNFEGSPDANCDSLTCINIDVCMADNGHSCLYAGLYGIY